MPIIRLKPPDIEGKAWFGAINARFPKLRNLFLFNDQGIGLRDAGQINHGTLTNGPTWGSAPIGRAVTFAKASSQYVDLSTPRLSGDITILVLACKTASTPGGGNLDPVWYTRTTGNGWGLDLGNSFDGSTPQRPHWVLFGGGTANAWKDGKKQAAGSGNFDADAVVNEWNTYVCTGAGSLAGDTNTLGRANIFYGNVRIALVASWARVLGDGEADDISGAPIETLFSPPSSQMGWRFTAATATTTPKLIGGNLIRPNLVRGRLAA